MDQKRNKYGRIIIATAVVSVTLVSEFSNLCEGCEKKIGAHTPESEHVVLRAISSNRYVMAGTSATIMAHQLDNSSDHKYTVSLLG